MEMILRSPAELFEGDSLHKARLEDSLVLMSLNCLSLVSSKATGEVGRTACSSRRYLNSPAYYSGFL